MRKSAPSGDGHAQEGNEVGIEFRDDGGGLDLERIRAKRRGHGPDRRPIGTVGDAERSPT